MWGSSIIGFGAYHYKYDSGHEGDAPLVGTLHESQKLVCILQLEIQKGRNYSRLSVNKHPAKPVYTFNKVDDIHIVVLIQLIKQSVTFLQNLYPEKK